MLGRARASLTEHNFFGLRWIIEKFNDRDLARVREIGPDRACAEWIVRCNGAVRFNDSKPEFAEYNEMVETLEATSEDILRGPEMYLSHIHADDACITARGCHHFEGVEKLHNVIFSGCKNIEDEGIDIMVKNVGKSLRSFELSDCRHITPAGLELIGKCNNLTSLIITDLPHLTFQDWEQLMGTLKKKLPRDCKIASDIGII